MVGNFPEVLMNFNRLFLKLNRIMSVSSSRFSAFNAPDKVTEAAIVKVLKPVIGFEHMRG